MPKLLLAAVLLAQLAPDLAGDRQFRDLIRMVDDVAAGRPGPADLSPQLQFHFLRAKDGRAFVPVAILFPGNHDRLGELEIYVRGVREESQRPETVPLEPVHGREAHRPSMRLFPIETGRRVLMEPGRSGLSAQVAFEATPGKYVIYGAVRERTTRKPRAGVFKRTIVVPAFGGPDLMVSSVIVAEQLYAVPQPVRNPLPYMLGTLGVVPSVTLTFPSDRSIGIVLLVYNAVADKEQKPDVLVEYQFYRVEEAGETFFTRTRPQELSANTLASSFDLSRGDQLVAGQDVPLSSFAPGKYRVEVNVTDRSSGKSALAEETFTVRR